MNKQEKKTVSEAMKILGKQGGQARAKKRTSKEIKEWARQGGIARAVKAGQKLSTGRA